jgi:hypothetical protein
MQTAASDTAGLGETAWDATESYQQDLIARTRLSAARYEYRLCRPLFAFVSIAEIHGLLPPSLPSTLLFTRHKIGRPIPPPRPIGTA